MRSFLLALTLFIVLPANAQTRYLKVEPNHSTVGFRIVISGATEVTGKFGDFQINLDWDDQNFTNSTIDVKIKAESINTGIPDRDQHLRTADFFDVEAFPEISFVSDSIKQLNFSNFVAHGRFSMRGVSKNIVLPFQVVKVQGNSIAFKIRTSINRIDYGVGASFQHTSEDNFLAEDIQVEIDFWTKKRKVE